LDITGVRIEHGKKSKNVINVYELGIPQLPIDQEIVRSLNDPNIYDLSINLNCIHELINVTHEL